MANPPDGGGKRLWTSLAFWKKRARPVDASPSETRSHTPQSDVGSGLLQPSSGQQTPEPPRHSMQGGVLEALSPAAAISTPAVGEQVQLPTTPAPGGRSPAFPSPAPSPSSPPSQLSPSEPVSAARSAAPGQVPSFPVAQAPASAAGIAAAPAHIPAFPVPVVATPSVVPRSALEELMVAATAKYEEKTGIKLDPIEDRMPGDSDDAVIKFLEAQKANYMQSHKELPEAIRKPLFAFVAILRPFCNTLGEGTAIVFAPGKTIFAGLELLLNAAEEASKDSETVISAFERITDIISRVQVTAGATPTPSVSAAIGPAQAADALRESAVKVLVEVLGVLSVIRTLPTSGLKIWLNKLMHDKSLATSLDRLLQTAEAHDRISIATAAAGMLQLLQQRELLFERIAARLDDVIYRYDEPRIRKWLKRSDTSAKFNRLRDNRLDGTGSWFLNGNLFSAFRSGALESLWVCGESGSGKSSLAVSAIESIRKHCTSESNAVLAYHMFDSTRPEPRDLAALLGSVTSELLRQDSDAHDLLLQQYEAHGHEQPSLSDLQTVFERIVSVWMSRASRPRVYILIDGLDEALPEATGPIVSWMETLLHTGTVSVFLTSRPTFPDKQRVREVFGEPLMMDSDGIAGDIVRFVDHALSPVGILNRFSNGTKRDEIKTHLISTAGSSFIWVTLQAQNIAACPNISELLREALRTGPPSLNEAYEQRLLALRPAVRTLLLWMALDALGPVSREMFGELLSFGNDPMHPAFRDVNTSQDVVDWLRSVHHDDDSVDDIVHWIGTAFVTQSKPDSRYNQSYIVFTHTSAKEFLCNAESLALDRARARMHVSTVFAAYLRSHALNEIATQALIATSRIYVYGNLREESETQIDPRDPEGLCRSVVNLFTSVTQNWMPQVRLALTESSTAWILEDRVKLAYVVAEALTRYAFSLADSGIDVSFCTSFTIPDKLLPHDVPFTALSLACYTGASDVVARLLTDRAWNANELAAALCCSPHALRSRDDRTSCDSLTSILHLLIDAGVDPNSTGGLRYNTAFQRLCATGTPVHVRLLITAGADVNLSTPPQEVVHYVPSYLPAARVRYQRLLTLVRGLGSLERTLGFSLDVGTTTPSGGAPAYLQHLFEIADLDNKGLEMLTVSGTFFALYERLRRPSLLHGHPLLAASAEDREDIVQILLEQQQLVVDASSPTSGSALQAAAAYGHLEIVELLLPYCSERGKLEAFLTAYDSGTYHAALRIMLELKFNGPTTALHVYVLISLFRNRQTELLQKSLESASARVQALAAYFIYFEEDFDGCHFPHEISAEVEHLPLGWREYGRETLQHFLPNATPEVLRYVQQLRDAHPGPTLPIVDESHFLEWDDAVAPMRRRRVSPEGYQDILRAVAHLRDMR